MDASLPLILPCVFCGDMGAQLTERGDGPIRVRCFAPECEARGPTRNSEAEAIYAWNASVPRTGPTTFTHWTCGTAHIRAERTLRIIERVRPYDLEAMEMIAGLVDEAGHDNAVQALDDGVPF